MYRSLVTYYDVLGNIYYLNGDISGDVISCSKYPFDLFLLILFCYHLSVLRILPVKSMCLF